MRVLSQYGQLSDRAQEHFVLPGRLLKSQAPIKTSLQSVLLRLHKWRWQPEHAANLAAS